MLQLVVMMAGFALAVPAALGNAGGVGAVVGPAAPPWFGDFTCSSGPGSGWTLLFFTLFVPVLGGLYTKRAESREAIAAIAFGVGTMFVARLGFAGDYRWLDPTLAGLASATAAFGIVVTLRKA